MATKGDYYQFYPVEIQDADGVTKGFVRASFHNHGVIMGCFSVTVSQICLSYHQGQSFIPYLAEMRAEHVRKDVALAEETKKTDEMLNAIAVKVGDQTFSRFVNKYINYREDDSLFYHNSTVNNIDKILSYYKTNPVPVCKLTKRQLELLELRHFNHKLVLPLKALAFSQAFTTCCNEAIAYSAHKISQWICGDSLGDAGYTAPVFEELARQGLGTIVSTPHTPNYKYMVAGMAAQPVGFTVFYPNIVKDFMYRDRYAADPKLPTKRGPTPFEIPGIKLTLVGKMVSVNENRSA